jgi:hypothetical protein
MSMILSDRVSGRVSPLGLVAPALLACAALPGWSLAQQEPAPRGSLTDPVDNRAHTAVFIVTGQDPSTNAGVAKPQVGESPVARESTSARLQKLEADIQRLSLLLKTPQTAHLALYDDGRAVKLLKTPQTAHLALYEDGRPVQHVVRDDRPSVNFVVRGSTDGSAPVVKVANGHIYVIAAAEKGAYLTALDMQGRQTWLTSFPAPQPIQGAGIEWGIEAEPGQKQVTLFWSRGDEIARFGFDAKTGKLQSDIRESARNLYLCQLGREGGLPTPVTSM